MLLKTFRELNPDGGYAPRRAEYGWLVVSAAGTWREAQHALVDPAAVGEEVAAAERAPLQTWLEAPFDWGAPPESVRGLLREHGFAPPKEPFESRGGEGEGHLVAEGPVRSGALPLACARAADAGGAGERGRGGGAGRLLLLPWRGGALPERAWGGARGGREVQARAEHRGLPGRLRPARSRLRPRLGGRRRRPCAPTGARGPPCAGPPRRDPGRREVPRGRSPPPSGRGVPGGRGDHLGEGQCPAASRPLRGVPLPRPAGLRTTEFARDRRRRPLSGPVRGARTALAGAPLAGIAGLRRPVRRPSPRGPPALRGRTPRLPGGRR